MLPTFEAADRRGTGCHELGELFLREVREAEREDASGQATTYDRMDDLLADLSG